MTPPKEFFSKEDCDCDNVSTKYRHNIIEKDLKYAISLSRANDIYEKRIRERSRVVYGQKCRKDLWYWYDVKQEEFDGDPISTHQALLICVEPISQPDDAERILKDFVYEWDQVKIRGAWINARDLVDRARKFLERKDGV